jgi:AcrR family transcriptional regulator
MRVDAVRNHNVILEVAGDLFCQHGPGVSMDSIASAACVGKGTLFRRFGDRDGLIQAVVSERTEAWWQGARARAVDESLPARERALRLVDEMFDLIVLKLRPLMAVVEKSACAGAPPPGVEQLAALIVEVRPDADGDFLARVIIGSMRGEMVAPGGEDTLRVNVAALTSSVLGD